MRVPSIESSLARRVLLHALPLVAVPWPAVAVPTADEASPPLPPPSPPAEKPYILDPFFSRLRNNYILFRPGETTFEAADIVDSNPINKGNSDRGLTSKGREQVLRSAKEIRRRGLGDGITIFYDNGARGTQTAQIISEELSIPRSNVEPEFRWLEARGLGDLEGTSLRAAGPTIRAIDALSESGRPEPTDDGTPADSVLDVFSRMRNTIAKCESVTAGATFLIVGGDATVLSVFAAAACQVDPRLHSRFELEPGGFFDLRQLQRDYRAGTFTPSTMPSLTEEEVEQGRRVIRELGPRVFSETGAGADLAGSGR